MLPVKQAWGLLLAPFDFCIDQWEDFIVLEKKSREKSRLSGRTPATRSPIAKDRFVARFFKCFFFTKSPDALVGRASFFGEKTIEVLQSFFEVRKRGRIQFLKADYVRI